MYPASSGDMFLQSLCFKSFEPHKLKPLNFCIPIQICCHERPPAPLRDGVLEGGIGACRCMGCLLHIPPLGPGSAQVDGWSDMALQRCAARTHLSRASFSDSCNQRHNKLVFPLARFSNPCNQARIGDNMFSDPCNQRERVAAAHSA